jgi:hypothetical protein
LGAFDATNETERTRTIAHTIQVSLDLIDNRGKVRFGELGVFPEDIDIPVGVIALLWKETGGLAAYEAEDLLSRLAGISLLQSLDLDQGVTRLHDNIRYFLREQAGAHGLIQQHRSLIRALEEFRDSVEMDAAVRLYYEYRYLSYHLAAAGQRDKLDALLLNPAWLQGNWPRWSDTTTTSTCRTIWQPQATARSSTGCCSTPLGCKPSWTRPTIRRRWWPITSSMALVKRRV